MYLDDYNVNVNLTSTLRCGYHQYEYKNNTNRQILFDLGKANSRVTTWSIGDNEIQGFQGGENVYFYYLGICGLESIEFLELAIPEDIAVICFDDHNIFKIFKPKITIIEQPIEEIAKTSIDMLINSIEEKLLSLNEYAVIKNTNLVVRESA